MGKSKERNLNILREKNKNLQRKIEKLRKQLNKFKEQINDCDYETAGFHGHVTEECCENNPSFERKIEKEEHFCKKCNSKLAVIEIAGRKIGKCQQCGYWKKIDGKED